MKRFVMIVALATVGLTALDVSQGQAAPRGGHSEYGRRHEGYHNFRASHRFGYDRYGYRSFSYSHYCWSSYYRCYCYYAPSYGWCFYEPTYSSYVPIKRYYEVYPESTKVISSPTVIQQQTTVVTAPGAPGNAVAPPPPPEVGPPAPTVNQQTKVGG